MKTKLAWLLGLAVIGGAVWYFAHNHQRAAEAQKHRTFTFEEATVAPLNEHPVILAFAWQDIEKFNGVLDAYAKELLALVNTQHAPDLDKIFELIHETEKFSIELEHIHSLLLVDALVQNEADRERIKPVLSEAVASVPERIAHSIELINLIVGHLKGQAAIATAIRLRDDLRQLRAVLMTGN